MIFRIRLFSLTLNKSVLSLVAYWGKNSAFQVSLFLPGEMAPYAFFQEEKKNISIYHISLEDLILKMSCWLLLLFWGWLLKTKETVINLPPRSREIMCSRVYISLLFCLKCYIFVLEKMITKRMYHLVFHKREWYTYSLLKKWKAN